MKRLLVAAAVVLAAAGSASADTFEVVEPVPVLAPLVLPSHEVPNVDGSLLLPPGIFDAPLGEPQELPYEELQALWHRAGAAYGVPWQVLGAINKIESNFGRNMGPSSAGAVGWMQFMPDTWLRWGMDAIGRRDRRPLESERRRLLCRALSRGGRWRGGHSHARSSPTTTRVVRRRGARARGGLRRAAASAPTSSSRSTGWRSRSRRRRAGRVAQRAAPRGRESRRDRADAWPRRARARGRNLDQLLSDRLAQGAGGVPGRSGTCRCERARSSGFAPS